MLQIVTSQNNIVYTYATGTVSKEDMEAIPANHTRRLFS